jgi:hypothetical protein
LFLSFHFLNLSFYVSLWRFLLLWMEVLYTYINKDGNPSTKSTRHVEANVNTWKENQETWIFTELLWCAPPLWTFELPKRHWWTRHQCHCHPKLWRSPQSLLTNQGSKCNIQSANYIGVLWAPHVDDATQYPHNSIRVKRNCGFLYCIWVCNAALSHSRPMLHFVFRFVPCLWFTCLNSAQLVVSLNP